MSSPLPPLELQELPVPAPGPGQVLVKTEARGVWDTDVDAADGDWPLKPGLPFIAGHEGIGIVVALGDGVTAVKEGDRVGVPWLYSACGHCGHCEYCLAAREPVCAQAQFAGCTQNGGFAYFIVADPNDVAHIPPGLAPGVAPLICASGTSDKGLKETQARPGQWVVVSGVGGLMRMAVQDAWAMGLRVCAVDVDDDKLAHAKRLEAEVTFNARHPEVLEQVNRSTDGRARGVLITAPSSPAFRQGVGLTRKWGTCVRVGIPPVEFPTPLFDMVARCITIRGSFVGSRSDMAEALALGARGAVKADIELQPLAAINSVLQRLKNGQVPSRVVLEFAA